MLDTGTSYNVVVAGADAEDAVGIINRDPGVPALLVFLEGALRPFPPATPRPARRLLLRSTLMLAGAVASERSTMTGDGF